MVTREIDLKAQDNELLISLFKDIIRLRKFEDKVYQLFLKGELPGTIHQYQGQEAVAVGICSVLEKNDWITSTHRPHGHAIAKGVKMRDAMHSTSCPLFMFVKTIFMVLLLLTTKQL